MVETNDLSNLTPAMKQYVKIKDENPDCVVLFRMGDFYETFYEDAKTASKVLGITLTSRGKDEKKAPLAGIPYHALDQYLKKLVKAGYKVALVEQLEDPKFAKGLVKRGLIRIITPGTLIEETLLSEKNNFIMSLCEDKGIYGLSFCDISTGEFLSTEVLDDLKLLSEIDRFSPSEIIVPVSYEDSSIVLDLKKKGYYVNYFDDRFFWMDKATDTIKTHFNIMSLEGLGIHEKPRSVKSSGALISYLKNTQKNSMSYLKNIKIYSVDSFMIIDSVSMKNLELFKNIRDNTSRGTLFDVINYTNTSMGARKLKQWLLRPLIDKIDIDKRLFAVEELFDESLLREELKEKLNSISDIERIISRITYGSANPRDLIGLRDTLEIVPKIRDLLKECLSDEIVQLKEMNSFEDLKNLINSSIKDEPSSSLKDGNIIKEGYNKELDELKKISSSGKKWISDFEMQEKERTGIKNLKVRYNKVFGYFIEITKSNLNLAPKDYIRKQTQVNCERFITESLKEKESLVLGANEKICALEYEIFIKIIEKISSYTSKIQDLAEKLSTLDCYLSLSQCATNNCYVRPRITSDNIIEIVDGRHPVVEKIESGSFVSNDTSLDMNSFMHIITGPNMAGKSTYLRQVALITILAQIGSFVPASNTLIGICDRVFTRVGAVDDLSMGQSTFMVEMNEVANILNNATERSLIIMDEVGRGTSTYDGLSLAWAICEYIHDIIKAKTLFATHYHQMNKISETRDKVKNYNILVKETDDSIIFLRKISEGGTDKSYGIHVAKIAGVPKEVISKAKSIQRTLEEQELLIKSAPQEIILKDNNPKIKDNKKIKELEKVTGQMSLLDRF
jgi:DNA mismatch repair protein MutS